MEIGRPILADVVTIDGRELFVALPLPEGGEGVFCRSCGAEARLEGGLVDLRALSHAAGCHVERVLADALGKSEKPVFLRHAASERRN